MAPQTKTTFSAATVFAAISKTAPKAPELIQSSKIGAVQERRVAMANSNMCGIQMAAWKDKKLSEEIKKFSASGADHRQKLAEGARILMDEMKAHFPESKVVMTGSFAAGVDIASSDLDFTMKDPSRLEENKYQKLKAIKSVLEASSSVFEKMFVVDGHTPVLQLVLKESKIEIDMTIDNDTPMRNTHLLSNYGKVDSRFPQLCRVIKQWAAETGVENSRKERLNSFSVCLLLIHYLQSGVTPSVLPNLQQIFPEYNGEYEAGSGAFHDWDLLKELEVRGIPLGQNTSSVGALLQGFFKFYSTFNFKTQWISIRRGVSLEKKRDEEKNPLEGLPANNWYVVVEDPFLETPWNCGRTLQQTDTLERVQEEFRLAEESIRRFHRLPFRKSIQRIQIDQDGKARDLEVVEVEEILRKGKTEEACGEMEDCWGGEQKEWSLEDDYVPCPTISLERQTPESFWDEKKEEYRPWPEIIAKVDF